MLQHDFLCCDNSSSLSWLDVGNFVAFFLDILCRDIIVSCRDRVHPLVFRFYVTTCKIMSQHNSFTIYHLVCRNRFHGCRDIFLQNILQVLSRQKTLQSRHDECKTHLCFEFISHDILCILYPYSCKTHKMSSKLGFVGLVMKIK